jgi:dephospho-CoA kinase
MLVVGLTGDVGAGKSTVARTWKAQGAFLIDSDEIVRYLWKTERLRAEVLSRFGERGIGQDNGEVDTSAVAQAVFENAEDYEWVCSLLHPMVFERVQSLLEGKTGWIVVELPLLFEAGRPTWLDLVVYVTAPEKDRISRTRSRGWQEDELRRREKWLLPSREKAALSDIVIENAGTRSDMDRLIKNLGQRMKEVSSLLDGASIIGEERKRLLEAIRA